MTAHRAKHPETSWLDVPGPVRKKRRVSRTEYWEACPACDQPISGWSTNSRVQPAYRLYEPCGCVLRASTKATA